MVAKSLLAPSRKRGASQVDLRYHVGDRPSEGGNWIAPEPVCVTMSRNELTILRYKYDPCCCRFKIFTCKRQLGDPAYHGCGITLFIDKTEV